MSVFDSDTTQFNNGSYIYQHKCYYTNQIPTTEQIFKIANIKNIDIAHKYKQTNKQKPITSNKLLFRFAHI